MLFSLVEISFRLTRLRIILARGRPIKHLKNAARHYKKKVSPRAEVSGYVYTRQNFSEFVDNSETFPLDSKQPFTLK